MTKRPMTLDGEYTALFASMYQRVPTFHRFGRVNRRTDEDVTTDFTACGRFVSSYARSTGKLREEMTWIPMRHALAFGRPCKLCFPSIVGARPGRHRGGDTE